MNKRGRLNRVVRTPQLIGRGINRLYHRRAGLREYNTRGINIFDEDWDNCLILDACPHKLFEKHNTIAGTLGSRISRASATVEFLKSNVAGGDLEDTVYVTANPQYERNYDTVAADFHTVVRVYEEEGWNEEIRTVLPETMTDRVLAVAEEYPQKRILAHFIQPHYPFLGDTAEEHFAQDNLAIWTEIMEGDSEYSDDILQKAFEETLEIAMPEVERAVEGLDGKTVVTADHGQAIGDRASPIPIKEYGHPRGIYIPELVKVPWLVCDDERRSITAEPGEEMDVNPDAIKDRLQELGYVE